MVTITLTRILFAAKHVLEGTTHEQTIFWRQSLACHVFGSWPMKRKEKMRQMIISIVDMIIRVKFGTQV